MNYLFVCGAPRSGTTAMWRFLTADPRIVLGVERYGNLFFRKPLTPELFEKERFSSLAAGDTFYDNLVSFNRYYADLDQRLDSAIFTGDKIPLLFNHLDALFEHIPDAKVIFMLRNVFDLAASYEARANNPDDTSWHTDKRTLAAIADWRASLEKLESMLDDPRVLPVVYESFFSGDEGYQAIYDFLDMASPDTAQREYKAVVGRARQLEKARTRAIPQEAVMQLCTVAPFGLYRRLLKRIGARSLAPPG